eukprot:TCONS_00027383-protein
METLVEGLSVYITQEHAAILDSKTTSTACVCFLTDVFYTKQEQYHINLRGANGRRPMHPKILSGILTYTLRRYPTESSAKLRVAMRNKLAQTKTRMDKTQNNLHR